MSHELTILKTEQNKNTIVYTIVLTPTLTIQNTITRELKEQKTIFSLHSTTILKPNLKGETLSLQDLKDELMLYGSLSVCTLLDALPYLEKLAANKPHKKRSILQDLKERLLNFRVLRLEPQPTF